MTRPIFYGWWVSGWVGVMGGCDGAGAGLALIFQPTVVSLGRLKRWRVAQLCKCYEPSLLMSMDYC